MVGFRTLNDWGDRLAFARLVPLGGYVQAPLPSTAVVIRFKISSAAAFVDHHQAFNNHNHNGLLVP